jgi:hypothetical protein
MVTAVMKSSSQIRGSCCPLNLIDYTVAELDSFWQWCGANQEAEALCPTQSVMAIAECLQFGLLFKATRIASRTC